MYKSKDAHVIIFLFCCKKYCHNIIYPEAKIIYLLWGNSNMGHWEEELELVKADIFVLVVVNYMILFQQRI